VSFPNKNQDLLIGITDPDVATMVSKALKREHTNDSSSVKNISARTGINRHTIAKWYQAINAPSSEHLLVLAAIYPEILKGLLKMIGRVDVWRYSLLKGVPGKMVGQIGEQQDPRAVYSDKFVHIDVVIDLEFATSLNQRQLWFLGETQNNSHVRADAIVTVWRKTLRTARRDIQGMLDIDMIAYCGAPKNGRYILCE